MVQSVTCGDCSCRTPEKDCIPIARALPPIPLRRWEVVKNPDSGEWRTVPVKLHALVQRLVILDLPYYRNKIRHVDITWTIGDPTTGVVYVLGLVDAGVIEDTLSWNRSGRSPKQALLSYDRTCDVLLDQMRIPGPPLVLCKIRRSAVVSYDGRRQIEQPEKPFHAEIRLFRFGDPTQAEVNIVAQHFNGDPNMWKFEIKGIHKVHNYVLYTKFNAKKVEMEANNGHNTTTMWHGCPKDIIPNICQEGFDCRLAGKNATMLGKGSYFARYPSYSHHFTKPPKKCTIHYLICTQVLLGRFRVGGSTLVRPPLLLLDGKQYRYDSVVDQLPNPTIACVFENCQTYPDFVVRYELRS